MTALALRDPDDLTALLPPRLPIPERISLVPGLPCPTCVRQPTCSIIDELVDLDAILPAMVHPAIRMTVQVQSECDFYRADVVAYEPGWVSLARAGALVALGAIVTGMLVQSGLVQP